MTAIKAIITFDVMSSFKIKYPKKTRLIFVNFLIKNPKKKFNSKMKSIKSFAKSFCEQYLLNFLNKIIVIMRSGGISNNGLIGKINQNLEIVKAAKKNNLYTNLLFIKQIDNE